MSKNKEKTTKVKAVKVKSKPEQVMYIGENISTPVKISQYDVFKGKTYPPQIDSFIKENEVCRSLFIDVKRLPTVMSDINNNPKSIMKKLIKKCHKELNGL